MSGEVADQSTDFSKLLQTMTQEREMLAELEADSEYNRIMTAIQADVHAGKFTGEYARNMPLAEIRKRYGGFENAIHIF